MFQGSGALFWLLPLYAYAHRRFGVPYPAWLPPYTPAQQCADVGLGMSSVVFWNYVMCHNVPGLRYGLVAGCDYIMIGANAVVSSCTSDWASRPSAFVGTAGALAAHYVRCNGLQKPAAFRAHVYLCMTSLAACAWRRHRHCHCAPPTGGRVRWAWAVRIYTTVVCTLFYYGRLRHIRSVHDFRKLKWWVPWAWHGHALASIVANRMLLMRAT